MKRKIVLLSLALAASPVMAEGVYLFGDLGSSKYEVDAFGDTASDNDTALGLGVGYSFNANFSIEAGYRDFGSISDGDEDYSAEVSASALQLSLLGAVPLSEQFSLFGRLGFGRLELEAELEDRYWGETYSGSDSTTKVFWGVGARYAFSEQFALRGEYNQYAEWEELTMSALVVGLEWHF